MTAKEKSPLEVLQSYRAHDYSLDDFIASRREVQATKPVLEYEGHSWNWLLLEEHTQLLASQLAHDGVRPGDRVMLIARNSALHVVALLAAARLGAIFVPINPQFKRDEARYIILDCEPTVVFVDAECDDVVRAVRLESPRPFVIHPSDIDTTLDQAPITTRPSDAEQACIMIYTSGTTGFPKGVVHSQKSFIMAGEAFVARLGLQPDERLMLTLPMFHINAMFYSVAGSFAAGATLLVEPRFSASAFWRRVKALRATQTNMIEAVVTILLNRPPQEFEPGHTLRKVYGIRQESMAHFREAFKVPVLVGGYAMTEIPGVISTPLDHDVPAHCMGVLSRHPVSDLKWAECRVVDDDKQDVPDGEIGELLVRTPVVMKGYFRNPQHTADSFYGDWFCTGDYVRRNAKGQYFFIARKKDIIRRRGENISGQELDRVISSHPGVYLAAAIGVPSNFGDEEILVAIQAKQGVTLKASDITEWCHRHLANLKVPRYVAFVDTLPMTPTHKVAKADLKKDDTLIKIAIDCEQQ